MYPKITNQTIFCSDDMVTKEESSSGKTESTWKLKNKIKMHLTLNFFMNYRHSNSKTS